MSVETDPQAGQQQDQSETAAGIEESPATDDGACKPDRTAQPADSADEAASPDPGDQERHGFDTPETAHAEELDEKQRSEALQRLLAMRVPVIVRLAQKKMRMAEILRLHLGSVMPFDQDAYRHIDLMVNNAVIGIGQAVKVGENFGLKITEMGPVADRIRSLGGDAAAGPGNDRTAGPSA